MILLKTLTKKSILPFGKHAGMTVGDLLNQNKIFLLYCYFNYDRLTFTEDVINDLNIREEDIINKPGKNPEKYSYYVNRNCYYSASIMNKSGNKFVTLAIIKKKSKNKNKSKYKALIEKEKRYYSKAAMQRRNHGKY